MTSYAAELDALDEDRYGERIDVACRGCEWVESVFFDRRTGRPWSSAEPCGCGAPVEERRAIPDGWEYR